MVGEFKHIYRWMTHPEELSAQHLGELDELCLRYPWSAPLQVLRAKAHKNANRFTFNSHLHKAAALVGDREVLYAFIQKEQEQEQADEAVKLEQEPAVEPTNEATEETVLEETTSEVEDVKTEGNEPPGEKETLETNSPELEEIEVPKVKEIGKAEESIPLDVPVYDPEKELQKLVQQPKEEEKEEEKELDFTSWLDALDGSEEPVVEQPRIRMDRDAQDLLAQFLEKRNRAREQRLEQKPREMKQEAKSEAWVSESLAALYVKQGHYAEAIEAYEKLSLQNPLKNAYFADLIQEVKKKQKET